MFAISNHMHYWHAGALDKNGIRFHRVHSVVHITWSNMTKTWTHYNLSTRFPPRDLAMIQTMSSSNFLWNFSYLNTNGPLWRQNHIGSGNGLVPWKKVRHVFCQLPLPIDKPIPLNNPRASFKMADEILKYLAAFRAQACPHITSSNGNVFHVTGPLCREFTDHRWIPLTKASDAELWCFLWSAPEQTVE